MTWTYIRQGVCTTEKTLAHLCNPRAVRVEGSKVLVLHSGFDSLASVVPKYEIQRLKPNKHCCWEFTHTQTCMPSMHVST